jgi:hypothetical protein
MIALGYQYMAATIAAGPIQMIALCFDALSRMLVLDEAYKADNWHNFFHRYQCKAPENLQYRLRLDQAFRQPIASQLLHTRRLETSLAEINQEG